MRMRSVVTTILIKLLMVTAICEVMLPVVGRVRPLPALWMALAVAVLTYILGDRGLLRSVGNGSVVLAEFILVLLMLFTLGRFIPGVRLPLGGALTVAGALSVAEILYHQYLLEKGVGIR